MKSLTCLILAFTISACSDDPKCGPDDNRAVDCKVLSETDCLAESECAAFYGNRIDTTAMCIGAEEMIACGSAASAECNNAIQGYVVGADGSCWQQDWACFGVVPGFQAGSDLPDTCTLVTNACGSKEVDCALLNETECLAEAKCLAVYGRKIDETAMCYGAETEMMACAILAVAECPNNAVGYASGPDGTCWFQPSVCGNIGDGYDLNAPEGSAACPVVSQACP